MLEGWASGIDINAWTLGFQRGIDFLIGPTGLLRGPALAFLAITIVGYAIYYGTSIAGVMFGTFSMRTKRVNRLQFEGAGTVWGTDRELQAMLNMGDYQKLSGKATTEDYVSTDAEGNEQSKLTVTRWSTD